MKIIIHDYSGHPFQVQLSRALSRLGHDVLHLYSASFQTPKGNLEKSEGDPASFDVRPLLLSKPFEKYSFIKRYFQEREYGLLAVEEIKRFEPDVIVNSNVPLDPLSTIVNYCKSHGVKTVFWWQDVYSIAINELLGKKFSVFGKIIGSLYTRKEKSILKDSNHIIGITDSFKNVLLSWGMEELARSKYNTIPNWAPIDEIVLTDKRNDWSEAQGLDKTFNFVYTGTLSYKHNPELLVALARSFVSESNVKIVVTTEGIGAEYLKEKVLNDSLTNLIVLPFQDFKDYSYVLGAADVLIAVLEKDAGDYSVPSKVLSYLSSGKPVLLAVPLTNLASFIIQENYCGMVGDTGDHAQFIKNAALLHSDRQMRLDMGKASRKYAEQNFNISHIADRFIEIIDNITNHKKL